MADLGFQIAKHPWFKKCVVKNAFKAIFGRDPNLENAGDKQSLDFAQLAYESSGEQFSEVLKALVTNRIFYAAY